MQLEGRQEKQGDFLLNCRMWISGRIRDAEIYAEQKIENEIFNLGICDAARPKVPANLDAACAAE